MALPARAHPPNLSFEQLPLPATNGYSVHTDCSSDPDDSSTEPEQDEQLDSPSFELSSSRPERHGFAELHSEAYLRELESVWFLYWTDPRHEQASRKPPELPVITVRKRPRIKTTQAALVLCLWLTQEPPDIFRTDPCAKLECWVDPTAIAKDKALDEIKNHIEQQYKDLASNIKIKFKTLGDPTLEDAKKTARMLRRQANQERVLYHYNGHGVPKPTESGEIWFFNRQYTQYMPVSLHELLSWLGSPTTFVWDCSHAGLIVSQVQKFATNLDADIAKAQSSQKGGGDPNAAAATPPPIMPSVAFSETIQLAACGARETLPMNPELPADLFTACLTSPIRMAVHFFILRNPLRTNLDTNNLDTELAYKIPGDIKERKSPMGELNWIFITITDSIAWHTLPKNLFQKLFREDHMLAALFRGFILAERIMRHFDCTPMSVPALPPTHNHPLWDAWDLVVDRFVNQLDAINKRKVEIEEARAAGRDAPPELQYVNSDFFSDQLTAFKLWLDQGSARCMPPPIKIYTREGKVAYALQHVDGTIRTQPPRPEQLPIVLQILMSPQHRLNALILLGRFLDLGFWAVDLALSIDIFVYVLKLLQAPGVDMKPVLIFILARIIAASRNQQEEFLRTRFQQARAEFPYQFFVSILASHSRSLPIQNVSEHRAMCAFVLAMFCRDFRAGQEACMEPMQVPWRPAAGQEATPVISQNVLDACLRHLSDQDPLLRQWAALCIAQLYCNYDEGKGLAIRKKIHEKFHEMLSGRDGERELVPEVRAAMLYALGTLVGTSGSEMLPPYLQIASDEDLQGHYTVAPLNSTPAPTLGRNAKEYYRKLDPQKMKPRASLSGASPERTGFAPHELIDVELGVAMMSLKLVTDGSPIVRRELAVLLSAIVIQHIGSIAIAAYDDYEREKDPTASENGEKASGRMSPSAAWAILEKEEQQRQDTLKSQGDEVNGDAPVYPAAASSSPAFRSMIFSCIYKSLLDLASDSYPEVAEPSSQVIDAIHSKMFNSPLATATGSVIKDIPEQIRRASRGKRPTHLSLSKSTMNFTSISDNILPFDKTPFLTKAPSTPLDKRQTFASAVRSFANFGFTESSRPKSPTRSHTFADMDILPRPEPSEDVPGMTRTKAKSVASSPTGNRLTFLDEDSTEDFEGTVEEAKAIILEEDYERIRRMRESRTLNEQKTPNDENQAHDSTDKENLPSPCEQLPLQSDFFDFCSTYFLEAQMKPPEADEPGSISFNERMWRRDRSERVITATQPLKEAAASTKWDVQTGLLQNDTPVSRAIFHQFEPHLVTADADGFLSVYDWSQNTKLHRFSNEFVEIVKNSNKYPVLSGMLSKRSTEVTSLKFVNEEDVALLMTGTADGNVRIFRNYEKPKEVELVSSFRALHEMVPTKSRESGLVLEWQQGRGNLLAGGNVKTLSVWDAPIEMCVQEIPTRSNSNMTCITSDQLVGQIVVAGFGDATVRVYDRRLASRDAMVRVWRSYHSSWIENVHMQRGGARELVSACYSGEVCMWDIRADEPIKKIEAYSAGERQSLTSLAVHEHAPVFATGSDTGVVKVWNMNTAKTISTFGNDAGFLGRTHRSGGISAMAFHPHHMVMATVTEDAHIGLYRCALNYDARSF